MDKDMQQLWLPSFMAVARKEDQNCDGREVAGHKWYQNVYNREERNKRLERHWLYNGPGFKTNKKNLFCFLT